MVLAKAFTDAQIADARERYNTTRETIKSIATRLGIDPSTFHKKLKTWGGFINRKDDPPLFATTELSSSSEETLENPPAASIDDSAAGGSLAERLERAATRDLLAVERMIDQQLTGRGNFIGAERAARTLTSLTRILKEVAALRDAERTEDGFNEENDETPNDIDELRRVLAARLDRLAGETRDGGADSGDEPS